MAIAQTAGVQTDIQVYRNSSADIVWTVTDENGQVIDLSADLVRMTIYNLRSKEPLQPLFSYDTGSGLVVSGASSNIVTVTYSTANTANIGSFRYDLLSVTRNLYLARGAFEVLQALNDGVGS